MSENALEDEESAWKKPTSEQRAELKRRRERDDQISSRMGEYLLKGYRMLGSTCSTCGAVLMRDRQSRDFCIGCEEIDKGGDKETHEASETDTQSTRVSNESKQAVASGIDSTIRFDATIATLQQQITLATQHLRDSSSLTVGARCELCQLIERAATAMLAVQRMTVTGNHN